MLRESARFLVLIILIFNFFVGQGYKDGGQIWKGWKIGGIGVFDVKFPKKKLKN